MITKHAYDDHLKILKVDIQGLMHEQHILVIVLGSKLFKLFRFKPTSLVCVFVNVRGVVVQHGPAAGLGWSGQTTEGWLCIGIKPWDICPQNAWIQDTALFDKFCGISDMLGHS